MLRELQRHGERSANEVTKSSQIPLRAEWEIPRRVFFCLRIDKTTETLFIQSDDASCTCIKLNYLKLQEVVERNGGNILPLMIADSLDCYTLNFSLSLQRICRLVVE